MSNTPSTIPHNPSSGECILRAEYDRLSKLIDHLKDAHLASLEFPNHTSKTPKELHAQIAKRNYETHATWIKCRGDMYQYRNFLEKELKSVEAQRSQLVNNFAKALDHSHRY